MNLNSFEQPNNSKPYLTLPGNAATGKKAGKKKISAIQELKKYVG